MGNGEKVIIGLFLIFVGMLLIVAGGGSIASAFGLVVFGYGFLSIFRGCFVKWYYSEEW